MAIGRAMRERCGMNRIDHLLWAAGDLDAAVAQFETMSGVRAAPGGSHPGRGTHNSLLSLGPGCYLELIAPDPAQDSPPALLGSAGEIERPFLFTFAVACSDIDATADAIAATGYERPKVEGMSRKTRDGGELSWRLARMNDHAFGPVIPFLIDWGSTPHPSKTTPPGCTLKELRVCHHDEKGVAALIASMGIEVQCRHGHAALTAVIGTPKGDLTLSSER
jgi:hypothetical protein